MKEESNQSLVLNHDVIETKDNSMNYLPKLKKARFIKVKVKVKDQPYATTLVNVFTFLPIPLAIGKMFSNLIVSKLNEHTGSNFTKKDFIRLINASKGLSVDVEAKEATVKVKIL
ncbi:hypothetical protein RJG79_04350 [Mycoplasmatota bacterium WC44]